MAKQKQTLTVQLMHANARIAELEAALAAARAPVLPINTAVTPARAAYLARRAHAQVNAQVSDFAQRCAQARAAAVAGNCVVRV